MVCLARVTKENFKKKFEVVELGGCGKQRGAGPGAIPQVPHPRCTSEKALSEQLSVKRRIQGWE